MANFLGENFSYMDRRHSERDLGWHRRHYETVGLDCSEMMKLHSVLSRYSWIAWTLATSSWLLVGLLTLLTPICTR